MIGQAEPAAGWIINGFQYVSLIWIWATLVLLFGLWRSMVKPDPNPIRQSGPAGL